MPYVPKQQSSNDIQHGRAAYRKGCRCDDCRHAETSYRAEYRKARTIIPLEELSLVQLRSLCWHYSITPSRDVEDMRERIRQAHKQHRKANR